MYLNAYVVIIDPYFVTTRNILGLTKNSKALQIAYLERVQI